MAANADERDLTLLVEKEILASHNRESSILNALDSSYGFNYSSGQLRKRKYGELNSLSEIGAKTVNARHFENHEQPQKRFCVNSSLLSHQHRTRTHENWSSREVTCKASL